MAVASIKAVFQNSIDRVWGTVTSLTNYAWRSDIKNIEIVDETRFIEYTKDGYATTFTITASQPCCRWEFDLENDNIKGHWVGTFTQNGEQTEIEFTEDVTAKKAVMKPFVKGYLKKQQAQYVSDLRRALS